MFMKQKHFLKKPQVYFTCSFQLWQIPFSYDSKKKVQKLFLTEVWVLQICWSN